MPPNKKEVFGNEGPEPGDQEKQPETPKELPETEGSGPWRAEESARPTAEGNTIEGPSEEELEQWRCNFMMEDFIKQRGGSVRFDEYMVEHLYGKEGYYTKRVEIGAPEDFTTYALKPEFAGLMAQHVEDLGLADQQFVEIAGGNGTFKKNYLQNNPGSRYISVDASPKLVALQKEVAPESLAVQADARHLPFENGSIEGAIFANELLDALPCRVLKLGHDETGQPRVMEEGAVTLNEDKQSEEKFSFVYQSAARDQFIEQYEAFLAESKREFSDGDVASVSPETEVVLRELDRVLKRGEIILPDYGFDKDHLEQASRKGEELPYHSFYGATVGVEDILHFTYTSDATYHVDFEYCAWLLRKIDPKLEVRYQPQADFLKDIKEKHGMPIAPDKKGDVLPLFKTTSFGVLSARKGPQESA